MSLGTCSHFSLADKWFYAAGSCWNLGPTYYIFTVFLKKNVTGALEIKKIRMVITIIKIIIWGSIFLDIQSD